MNLSNPVLTTAPLRLLLPLHAVEEGDLVGAAAGVLEHVLAGGGGARVAARRGAALRAARAAPPPRP